MTSTNQTLLIGIIMLVAGLTIGYFVAGASAPRASHMMSDGSMMQQNIDQHFIAQMIPHHEGAIEMAKVALERSKRPEVLSLATGIIEAQEKEIADMKSWHQKWFGSAPAVGHGGMHMDGMEGDTEKLKTIAASDFDREFIEQMIPHHEMAVMMAQMLQASTERPEMATLSDQIITSQTREIQMMRSWLKSW